MSAIFVPSRSEWRIESWSVLDGIAFASEWAEESELTVTVVVSPPDWSVVTIANRSTALLAARGPFQEGFFTEEGEEIAFDSLDEVIELVRRAYLNLLCQTDSGARRRSGVRPREAARVRPGSAGLVESQPTAVVHVFSQRQRFSAPAFSAGSAATPAGTRLETSTPLEHFTGRRRVVVVDRRTQSPSGEPRAGLSSGE